MEFYIILTLSVILIFFYIFLYLLKLKINKLEKNIINKFHKKNYLIPSIFEISKNIFVKHEEIFNEILKLRKIDFSEKNTGKNLSEIIKTQTLIHNELNFIFKVSNKHKKLYKEEKFLYINDLILEHSSQISKKLKLYKKIIAKYNFLINIKNYTIVGLLIPIYKIDHF